MILESRLALADIEKKTELRASRSLFRPVDQAVDRLQLAEGIYRKNTRRTSLF